LPRSLPSLPIAALLPAGSVASRDDSDSTPSSRVDHEEDASGFGGPQQRRALLAANVIGRCAHAAGIADSLLGLIRLDPATSEVIGVVIVPVEQRSALIPAVYTNVDTREGPEGEGLALRPSRCLSQILPAGSDMPRADEMIAA